jgi:hypothetical protein
MKFLFLFFWYMTPRILVYRYRRFGGTSCLHCQSNPETLLFLDYPEDGGIELLRDAGLTYHFTRRLSNWNLKTKIVFIRVIVVQVGNASLGQQVNVAGNCFSQTGNDVATAFVSFTRNPSCSKSLWSR